MATVTRKFNDKNLSKLIRLFKAGKTIAQLKKIFRTYGNPLVRRLKDAGVYRKQKAKAAAKPAKKTHRPAPKPHVAATRPVDPLANTTVVDGNGAPVGKASAFTPEEQDEIAGYQKEGITRKSAIQKLRRRQAHESTGGGVGAE